MVVNDPVPGPSIREQVKNFTHQMGMSLDLKGNSILAGRIEVSRELIEEAARERHPIDHEVDDPFGATGTARSDPYGYEDTARQAFIEGVDWLLDLIRDQSA